MRDENKKGSIEVKDEAVFSRAEPTVLPPSSLVPHPLRWSSLWSRLWKALGIATGIAALVLFVAFLVLEAIGLFYCEWNGILGCSTLSYWSVANFGAVAMIRGTLIAAAVVNVFLAWLCFHWWDVARRQKR